MFNFTNAAMIVLLIVYSGLFYYNWRDIKRREKSYKDLFKSWDRLEKHVRFLENESNRISVPLTKEDDEKFSNRWD
jgi:hypothetical protein